MPTAEPNGTMTDNPARNRRAVLAAAAGSLAGLAGCPGLRTVPRPASGVEPATTFILAARAGAWRGLQPDQIRGERNPILRPPTGARVEVGWRNVDGSRHRLAIRDSLGNTLVESPESSAAEAVRTVRFVATEEMTTYLDPGDPVRMRGELLVTG